MNKLIIPAAVLMALSLGACKKKQSTVLPPPVTDTVYVDSSKNVDTSLTISGIKDMRTYPLDMFTLPVTVTRNIGAEQKVTMSVSGLPDKVKAKWSSMSGYTTFNTNLELNTLFATPGTYPLTINSTTDKGKSKDYYVNLVIDTLTQTESNAKFLAALGGTSVLQTMDTALDSVVYKNTYVYRNAAQNEFYFTNVVLSFSKINTQYYISSSNGSNNGVTLNVNMNYGTVVIPEQKVQGRSLGGGLTKEFTISGSGNIDPETGEYEIGYLVSYDDNGSTVVKTYILKGRLNI